MIGKPINYKSFSEGTTYTINDRSQEALTAAPFYWICVESVDGVFGADLSLEMHPIPNLIGDKSGDAFRRGKTLTFSGRIYGRGLAELYEGAYYLERMLAELKVRKLEFTPWNFNLLLHYKCVPSQDLSVNMQPGSKSYNWPYTFALRAPDPRSYNAAGAVTPTWQA